MQSHLLSIIKLNPYLQAHWAFDANSQRPENPGCRLWSHQDHPALIGDALILLLPLGQELMQSNPIRDTRTKATRMSVSAAFLCCQLEDPYRFYWAHLEIKSPDLKHQQAVGRRWPPPISTPITRNPVTMAFGQGGLCLWGSTPPHGVWGRLISWNVNIRTFPACTEGTIFVSYTYMRKWVVAPFRGCRVRKNGRPSWESALPPTFIK